MAKGQLHKNKEAKKPKKDKKVIVVSSPTIVPSKPAASKNKYGG